jgi:hypothetical protein
VTSLQTEGSTKRGLARLRPGREDRPPCVREIEAAIAAYNETDPDMLLPPEAARLLAVMFPTGDLCSAWTPLRREGSAAGASLKRRSVSSEPGSWTASSV